MRNHSWHISYRRSRPPRDRLDRRPLLAVCAAGAACLLGVGCGPLPDARQQEADLMPPQVQSVQATGPAEVAITFDEDATLCPGTARITPALSVDEIAQSGRSVILRGGRQAPGVSYSLEAEARDSRGNTASFAAEFFGYNPRVPRLLINELTPRGSGTHPDAVELKCLTAGNVGGVALFFGSPGSHDGRFILPPLEVAAGTFIVLHLKPTGNPDERDETTDPGASAGADASDTAFDLWLRDAPGLPGNNGALALCDRPGGTCMDAILWSNRNAESDERYRGFGAEQMRLRAEELAACGAWIPEGDRINPEDCVSPEGSTGTRSLCRTSASADTNSAADWHVVPTKKASLGRENSDEVYVPAESSQPDSG